MRAYENRKYYGQRRKSNPSAISASKEAPLDQVYSLVQLAKCIQDVNIPKGLNKKVLFPNRIKTGDLKWLVVDYLVALQPLSDFLFRLDVSISVSLLQCIAEHRLAMDLGACKWIPTITLAFLFLIFTASLWNLEPNQADQYPFPGDLTNMILDKLEGWSLGKNGFTEDINKRGLKAVGPNLTTCHPSYGRTDLLVNCCPSGFQSPVPLVDFQFPDPQSPLRIRRPAHAVDADFLAKYDKALSIMKSLPHDDPRSFNRLANLHCLFCTGAYDQQNYNAPVSIHRTWLFFPWHRMMIYFHERIIGSLIGDETFALPYWAWDIPEGMMMPDMYTNKSSSFFHTERDASHLPPNTADLNYVSDTNISREDQLDINLSFMYNQMVSGARKTELFMGCKYKAGTEGYCDGPGTIELAPHNALHTWVGSSLNPGREDMGKFYSAARDPIFYAHHSNIDRLWEVWTEVNKHQLDITDPDWLESFFFFYDENLRLCSGYNQTGLFL
ncbi:hypothetical protein GQ457_15G013720 [Hibiscus cannabinus]